MTSLNNNVKEGEQVSEEYTQQEVIYIKTCIIKQYII